ncbi:MAG: ATP phosphoribosyltransferase, partial [bacterium]
MSFEDQGRVRLGVPKGSLQEATLALFDRAGFHISVNGRSYFPRCDDEELAPILLRAQEIPRYVADGALDAGITGHDWVVENKVDVIEVADLVYAKQSMRPVRWVLAVHEDADIHSVEDLEGKTIATEVVNITKDYLASHGVNAKVEFSWGA